MHWKIPASSRFKKIRMLKSKFEDILIVFFNTNGIWMTEWVPENQTVNQTYYLNVMATLQKQVCEKCLEWWKNKSQTCPQHAVCEALFSY